MNEQPLTSPAALDENAPERKIWAKPEIQELDHELTENSRPHVGGYDGIASYSYAG